MSIQALESLIEDIPDHEVFGRVGAVRGLMIEIVGPLSHMELGGLIAIEAQGGERILCEVVGFDAGKALVMPFANIDGLRRGCPAHVVSRRATIRPGPAWLGRVVDAFGRPIDGKGPIQMGPRPYPFRNEPPAAHKRQRVGEPLDLGVRALNSFLTTCRGQRMGIFAGSGVGKSVLLSMLARNSASDVAVVGLVGERGREVQEFIEDDLGEEGLRRSVVVVATSSESALMRRQAAYTTLAVSEYFRDQKNQVLLLMDSVTRFAMAQREIGLSAGEPPTTKGYTPTVFAELPKLLERAGPGPVGSGNITAMLSVLVEGGDTDEPIADAVRGIIDGHIVLDREIAQRGRYPAINILKSVSRMLPDANNEEENKLITIARRFMATYENMAELIRLGAYRRGTDPEVDRAMHFYPQLESFITQREHESANLAEGYELLAKVLGIGAEQPKANA